MTMVAACSFADGAVIVSDSRATWKGKEKSVADDRLQKIMHIGPKISLSFAGSGYLASKVIQHIRVKIKSNKKGYQHIRKISIEIPRIAKHYFNRYPAHAGDGLALILAGIEPPGRVLVYCYRSPNFIPEDVSNSYTIIGSGEVVRPYLVENFTKLNVPQNTLKQKADILYRGLDTALGQYHAEYVGGLFQVILISPEGIAPLQHYSMEIDPDGPANYMGIHMEKGRWIQEAEGKEMFLMEPQQLTRVGPQEKRVYEYFSQAGKQELRYYLSYFVTCLKVERTPSDTAFYGALAEIGSHRYPRIVPILACLGFWGPGGERDLQFKVDYADRTKVVHSQKVGDWYYPERFEIDTTLNIEAESPGPIFLDCLIDGNLLARKALYFADLRNEGPPKSKEEMAERCTELSKRMPDEHSKCSDYLFEKKNTFLDYFFLCQNVSYEEGNTIFKIFGEIRAIYWKAYPLTFKFCLATSLRMKPGHHLLEIKLKYAMTGEEQQIAKCELDNNSSCISTPIYADDLVVQIRKAGIYYVNAYVDTEFVGCVLLFAETDKPEFSYSLYKEDIDRIANGELFILASRSQQKPSSNVVEEK